MDYFVYFKLVNYDLYIYLMLYLDDMLIACSQRSKIEDLKILLNSEFDMKDLGYAKKILGMEIRKKRKNKVLSLKQEKSLQKVIDTFEIQYCKSVMTLLAVCFRLSNL